MRTEAVEITVCICTHRRLPLLKRCLHSLARQQDAPGFIVLVIDNDETDAAAGDVAAEASRLGLNCRYLHAPAHNIAHARNAALAACQTPLLAFFDDDQEAHPDWLHHLHQALQDVDAVFGPVEPVYPEAAPDWLHAGRFHRKSALRSGSATVIGNGYTANVLLRRSRLADLNFALEMGRSGGEDTLFFQQWASRGARYAWAPSARAVEAIAPERCRMAWLRRRQRASGHVHARLCLAAWQSIGLLFATAMLKYGYCQVSAVLHALDPVRWRADRLRGALHAGVLAALLGVSAPDIYGGTESPPNDS